MKPNIQLIAFAIVVLAVFVGCFAYCVGRGDAQTREPVTLAIVSLMSGLLGLGGGILTGKSITEAPIPPGSNVTSTTSNTIHTPPSS
jgi:hypothetical protein